MSEDAASPGRQVEGAAIDVAVEPGVDALLGWVLLYDPRWDPRVEGDEAPQELIAGGWPVSSTGEVGIFHANDLHRAAPGAGPDGFGDPDPLGAALTLVMEDRAPIELAQLVLLDCAVSLGMNADGRPVVIRSPDGRLCLLAATCEERRAESDPPVWERVGLRELVDLLPDDVDVLFNAAGPGPIRLEGSLLRDAVDLSPAAAAAVLDAMTSERASGLFGREDVQLPDGP